MKKRGGELNVIRDGVQIRRRYRREGGGWRERGKKRKRRNVERRREREREREMVKIL